MLLGIESITSTIFLSVELYPRGKVISFHDTIRYLTYETEVKLIFQVR